MCVDSTDPYSKHAAARARGARCAGQTLRHKTMHKTQTATACGRVARWTYLVLRSAQESTSRTIAHRPPNAVDLPFVSVLGNLRWGVWEGLSPAFHTARSLSGFPRPERERDSDTGAPTPTAPSGQPAPSDLGVLLYLYPSYIFQRFTTGSPIDGTHWLIKR